jgi:hypothetical protein
LYAVYPLAEAIIEYYEEDFGYQLDVDIPLACGPSLPMAWCLGFDEMSGLGPVLCSNLPD